MKPGGNKGQSVIVITKTQVDLYCIV